MTHSERVREMAADPEYNYTAQQSLLACADAYDARQWREIDDEAKSGKPVLLLFPNKSQHVGYCQTYQGKWSFWRIAAPYARQLPESPTHWMPLPPAPEA